MAGPKILIAKYVPDLHRAEPRNIGVIMWSPNGVAAKFLGEQLNGTVRPPAIVSPDNRRAYKEWINYWRALLEKESIKSGSATISRSAPEYVNLLRSKAKPNFLLVEAGSLIEQVATEDLSEATEEFFERLVHEEVPAQVREHAKVLREASLEVFRRTKLLEREDFKKRMPVPCRIGPVTKPFIFDYAICGNGVPKVVFQQAALLHDKSVNSTAFMFERLKSSRGKLRHARTCALVLSTDSADADMTATNLAILEQFAKIVDLADMGHAEEQMGILMNQR